QILSMIIVLALVGVGVFFAYPTVSPIFLASPWLNGVILAVFVAGVFACFWQVLTLISAVSWIEGFALDRPGHEFTASPRLLASLAALLSDKSARKALTSTSTRSILDSVATRLDEARDITRYIINLLIFLGLLGTFYGLATTVPAVVDTIRSLAPQEGSNAMQVFDNLMTGLEEQLGGMGTAFASSLLGLAGSLVVGLLELFAGHGQNRFYRELEEWLSSITRIGLVSSEAEDSGGGSSLVAGMMEQTALQIEDLKEIVMRGEERRIDTETKIGQLTDAIGQMTGRVASQGSAAPVAGVSADPAQMDRFAHAQLRLAEALEAQEDAGGGMDAETRNRLRNIDTQMLRILEEMSAGRQDTVAELRHDLHQLTQAIQALAERR
ncbi:MAG: biopolymer transporter ExbB, partial [Pseudomonadota bacterium]